MLTVITATKTLLAMRTGALRAYAPLIIVTAFTAVIKAVDPISSPVVGALDPWEWTAMTRQFMATGALSSFFTQTGYPPTFIFLVAALSSFGIDPYQIIRFIPIATALNVIPIYLLALEIFRSHRVATFASVLTVTDGYYFMRTSIGIPEGLSHLFFAFTLLFILRGLISKRRRDLLLAVTLLTTSLLYYHFLFIIVIPFAVVLIFTFQLGRRYSAGILVTIIAPALAFSAGAWYLRILPNMIRYYSGTTKFYTHQSPIVQLSATGIFGLAASVGNAMSFAVGQLGYILVLFGFGGFVLVFILRHVRHDFRAGVGFLVIYVTVLALLTIAMRLVYNLGLAGVGAGASSVYMLNWLVMPTAMLAGYAIVDGLDKIGMSRAARLKRISYRTLVRVLTVVSIISLCVVNLSAINYGSVPDASGDLGILQSHYYFKVMTGQEYYAFDYIRQNTPRVAIVLAVGVEEPILTYEAIASERTVIGIQSVTVAGQNVTLSAFIAYPDRPITPALPTANLSTIKMNMQAQPQHPIYLITGIRKVNLDVAESNGFPPPNTALLDALLVNIFVSQGKYEQFYQNEQVSIVRVSMGQLEYQNQTLGQNPTALFPTTVPWALYQTLVE